jgi:outer membrane protein assembly factor BamB
MRLLLILAACGGFPWRLQTAATPWPPGPAVALRADGEILYVLGKSGLSAHKEGARLWSVGASGRHLAVGDGLAVVSGAHVIAVKEGVVLWDQPYELTSPAVIGGGKVLFVADNLLVAVDAAGGHILWQQPIAVVRDVPFSRVAPALASGKACSGLGWEVNVVDLDKGAKGAHEDAGGGGIAAPLAALGATCYFAESRGAGVVPGDNTVVAVGKWRRAVGGEGGVGSLLGDGTLIFAATNDRVVALDGETGAVRWTVKGAPAAFRRTHAVQSSAFAFGGLTAGDDAAFTAGGGKLFLAASHDGRDVVTALDQASGAYLGSWDPGGGEVRAVAVAGHTLWVGTSAGLFAVPTSSFSM